MATNIIFYSESTILSIILLALIIINLYCYLKVRRLLLNLTIFLFSIPIALMALNVDNFPFTPIFQLFFLFFQFLIFFLMAIEAKANE